MPGDSKQEIVSAQLGNHVSRGSSHSDTAFSFVCLGVGGGPFDDNCSCYVMKPADRAWHEGTILVEGGSFLGSLMRCLENPAESFYDAQFPKNLNAESRAEVFNSWISKVLVSHGHLDHIYGLVLASASIRAQRPIYGLPDTLESILSVFDGRVWPRLASYDESDPMAFYHLRKMQAEQSLCIAPDIEVIPYPISHGPTRLAAGVSQFDEQILQAPRVEDCHCHMNGDFSRTVSTAFHFKNRRLDRDVLFLGDVEPDQIAGSDNNLTLWEAVAKRAAEGKLKAVFIECSFASEQPSHLLFGHLTPIYLYKELEALARCVCAARKQDESSLENSLRGLKCIVIHVKGMVLSADPSYSCCNPIPKTTSATSLPLPIPILQLIEKELHALESKGRLGVEFVMANRGQRIGTCMSTVL